MRLNHLTPALLLSGLLAPFASQASAETVTTTATPTSAACRPFESFVGGGKVNIVDFRKVTGGAKSPYIYRLAYSSFQNVPQDGYFGRITKGKVVYSYLRQNNPEVAYDPKGTAVERITRGPAYGDTLDFTARELGCNTFEVYWKEPKKGDTVTQLNDFSRQQVCTNVTPINTVSIPSAFDPLDVTRQLDDAAALPNGNPADGENFFYSFCGTMSQSLISARVWENQLHALVYEGK